MSEERLLQTDQPLYLPEGSVRSILALAVVGAFFIGLVPEDMALGVLAFYFAARTASSG